MLLSVKIYCIFFLKQYFQGNRFLKCSSLYRYNEYWWGFLPNILLWVSWNVNILFSLQTASCLVVEWYSFCYLVQVILRDSVTPVYNARKRNGLCHNALASLSYMSKISSMCKLFVRSIIKNGFKRKKIRLKNLFWRCIITKIENI